MTQYSIVVDLPELNNTIFIARPFSPDFDAIRDAILQAIAGVKLVATGTDLNPENVSFKDDIKNKILEARIVIAVCSQESTTKKPNPNVMYELGFARSIGKPTVVLMTEETYIPGNLQGDQVSRYQQGQESAIVPRLTATLTRLIANSLVIDKASYPGIWVASAHHRLILDPDLWHYFLSILKFAKVVHTLFFDLNSSHVDSLRAAVEAIARGAIAPEELPGKRLDCAKDWINYMKRYDTAEKDFFTPLSMNTIQVTHAADELETHTGDIRTKELLTSVQKYLKAIDNQLERFLDTHKDIIASIAPRRGFTSIFDTRSNTEEIWGFLVILSQACLGLTSNADALITTLTELLEETERLNT
jgi:hypothetical protein